MDGIAGGFFADVFAFGVGEAGEGVADVDAADIGWGALRCMLASEVLQYRGLGYQATLPVQAPESNSSIHYYMRLRGTMLMTVLTMSNDNLRSCLLQQSNTRRNFVIIFLKAIVLSDTFGLGCTWPKGRCKRAYVTTDKNELQGTSTNQRPDGERLKNDAKSTERLKGVRREDHEIGRSWKIVDW